MERGDDLQKRRKALTRTEFEKKYDHLWLIRELDPDELLPSSFNTVAWDSRKTLHADRKPGQPDAPLAAQLRDEPGQFVLYPVAKSKANPWTHRILVGRAANNDIVFRHESVSKLHAYFETDKERILRLHDAKSANGTRVDGQRIAPGSDGVEVTSGTPIRFGLVVCEVIDSGDLYDALY